MSVEKIASKIKEAEKRKQKVAMFHFQVLVHANRFEDADAKQFCRDVGMRDSFAIEFRKMQSLSQMIKDEGYVLKKHRVKTPTITSVNETINNRLA